MSRGQKTNKKKLVLAILAELSYLLLVIALNFSVRYVIDDLQYKTQDIDTINELKVIEERIIVEYNDITLKNNAISRFNLDKYREYNIEQNEIEVRIYYKDDNNLLEIEKNDYILKIVLDKYDSYVSSEIVDARPFTESIEEHIIATAIAMIIGLFYITFVRLRLSKIPSKIKK